MTISDVIKAATTTLTYLSSQWIYKVHSCANRLHQDQRIYVAKIVRKGCRQNQQVVLKTREDYY